MCDWYKLYKVYKYFHDELQFEYNVYSPFSFKIKFFYTQTKIQWLFCILKTGFSRFVTFKLK